MSLEETDKDNYCSVCGQAIYWSEENEIGDVSDKIKAIEPQIIVTGTIEKPYYEILYYNTEDKTWHIGFSSYDLSNVVKWKQEFFEVVGRIEDMKEGSVDD